MKKSNINPESFKEAKTASTVLGQATMKLFEAIDMDGSFSMSRSM
jgi:hypothetical protein